MLQCLDVPERASLGGRLVGVDLFQHQMGAGSLGWVLENRVLDGLGRTELHRSRVGSVVFLTRFDGRILDDLRSLGILRGPTGGHPAGTDLGF